MKRARFIWYGFLFFVMITALGCSSKSNTTEPKKPAPTMSFQAASTANGINRDVGVSVNTTNIPSGFTLALEIVCTTTGVQEGQKAGELKVNGVTYIINRGTNTYSIGGLTGNVAATVRMTVISTLNLKATYQSLIATKTLEFFDNAVNITMSPINTSVYPYTAKIGIKPFDSIVGNTSILTGDIRHIEHKVIYSAYDNVVPQLVETFERNYTNPISISATTPTDLVLRRAGNVTIETVITLDDNAKTQTKITNFTIISANAPDFSVVLRNQNGNEIQFGLDLQYTLNQAYSLDTIRTMDRDGYIVSMEYSFECMYNTSVNIGWTRIYDNQNHTEPATFTIANIPEPTGDEKRVVVRVRATDNSGLVTTKEQIVNVNKNVSPVITIDNYPSTRMYNQSTLVAARVVTGLPNLVTLTDIKWHITYDADDAEKTHIIDNDALSITFDMKAVGLVKIKLVATTSRGEIVESETRTIAVSIPAIADPVLKIREYNNNYMRNIVGGVYDITQPQGIPLYYNNTVHTLRFEYDAIMYTGFTNELLFNYRLVLKTQSGHNYVDNKQITYSGETIGYYETTDIGVLSAPHEGFLVAEISLRNHRDTVIFNTITTNVYVTGSVAAKATLENNVSFFIVDATAENVFKINHNSSNGYNNAPLETAVWYCTPITYFPGSAVTTTVDLSQDADGTKTYTKQKPGEYNIRLKVIDVTGKEAESDNFNMIVKNTNPEVSIVSITQTPIATKQNEVRVRVIFTATDSDTGDNIATIQPVKSSLHIAQGSVIDSQHFARYNPGNPAFDNHYYVDFTATNTSLDNTMPVYATIIVTDQITVDTGVNSGSMYCQVDKTTSSVAVPVRINIAPTLTSVTYALQEKLLGDTTSKVVGNRSITFDPANVDDLTILLNSMTIELTGTDPDGDDVFYRVGFRNASGDVLPSNVWGNPDPASGTPTYMTTIMAWIDAISGGNRTYDCSSITHIIFYVRDSHGASSQVAYPVRVMESYSQRRETMNSDGAGDIYRQHDGMVMVNTIRYGRDNASFRYIPLHGAFNMTYRYESYKVKWEYMSCGEDDDFAVYMSTVQANNFVKIGDSTNGNNILYLNRIGIAMNDIHSALNSAGQSVQENDMILGKAVLKNAFYDFMGCVVEQEFNVQFIQPAVLGTLTIQNGRDTSSYSNIAQYTNVISPAAIVYDTLEPNKALSNEITPHLNAYAGDYLRLALSLRHAAFLTNTKFHITYKVYFGNATTPAVENSVSVYADGTAFNNDEFTTQIAMSDILLTDDCRVTYTIYDTTTFKEHSGSVTVNVTPKFFVHTVHNYMHPDWYNSLTFNTLQTSTTAPILYANHIGYQIGVNFQTMNMAKLAGKYWVETYISYDQYGDDSVFNVRTGSWQLVPDADTPKGWAFTHADFPMYSAGMTQYVVIAYKLQTGRGIITRRSVHPITVY